MEPALSIICSLQVTDTEPMKTVSEERCSMIRESSFMTCWLVEFVVQTFGFVLTIYFVAELLLLCAVRCTFISDSQLPFLFFYEHLYSSN